MRELFLNNKEFQSDSSGLLTYDSCITARIYIDENDSRNTILSQSFNNHETFSIIIETPRFKYGNVRGLIRFNKCVWCGYGKYNGKHNYHINYWVTDIIKTQEKREILINEIVK